MNMNHYVLVSGDDWIGLYINGFLVYQDHSIEPGKLFEIIMKEGNGQVDSHRETHCDCHWLSDVGYLPSLLSDVKY